MMFHSWIRSKISGWYLALVFVVAVSGLALIEGTKERHAYRAYKTQLAAARLMNASMREIRRERLTRGIPIDTRLDPNETGLIGNEYSALTTTLGNLEAKRTATNPDFAALMVKFFSECRLQSGDIVAINASGSFPMLILATLSAVKAMNLKPLLIYSFGASMYGANIPEFTFLVMLCGLRENALLPYKPIAVSLGGNLDRAEGLFESESKEVFLQAARAADAPFIYEENLADSIGERLYLYQQQAGRQAIGCFVNIGGSSAGYGDTGVSLKFPNGVVAELPFALPEQPNRGLIFEFAARGIPVIHLLNIRELATSHRLPIDPVPLPIPGEGAVYYQTTYRRKIILLVLMTLFLLIGGGKIYAPSRQTR